MIIFKTFLFKLNRKKIEIIFYMCVYEYIFVYLVMYKSTHNEGRAVNRQPGFRSGDMYRRTCFGQDFLRFAASSVDVDATLLKSYSACKPDVIKTYTRGER